MAVEKMQQDSSDKQLNDLKAADISSDMDIIPFVGIGSMGIKAGAKVAKEAIEYLAEHSPGLATKAKEVVVDVLHRLGTPQNPSGTTMKSFEEKLNGTDLTAVVKEQLKAVPGGWVGLGGGSIVASSLVVSHYTNEREEEIAKKPLTEQKAIWFDRSAGGEKSEAEALKKFPDLAPYFEKYHSIVKQSLEDHPVVGGRSDAASSEIYRGKQALFEQIKHPEAEKQSNVDSLSVNQKLALLDQHISKFPEHQQTTLRETVAHNLNNNGIQIEESGVNQPQIEKA